MNQTIRYVVAGRRSGCKTKCSIFQTFHVELLAAPALRRLGRAGLEALPLRARKFLSFSHPENVKLPCTIDISHKLKLRLKATFDFSTFRTHLHA